jgi:DNA-binding NtrC family response regulator
MASLLVVDDEPKLRHILRIKLESRGYAVDDAENGRQALEMLESGVYDLVISDIKMPVMDGFELLAAIKEMDYPCPVIFITAFASIDSAVDSLKKGAIDYISKPFEDSDLFPKIEKALGVSRLMAENKQLKDELNDNVNDGMICVSKSMQEVMKLAGMVARKPDTTVLITGESGTGKEVLARYIHQHSPRARGRFVAVNSAAITDSLVESTLFGHEKGAFTGANKLKQGVFEYAQGGTLFLDEIGDLPLEAQAKLLRALQERVVQRVGGNRDIQVDVRVVCATNQDLEKCVEEGRFRSDLFYRINVFPLHIPPLRERMDAIVPLAEHFIEKFAEKPVDGPLLTQGAKKILASHSWPGNIRELSNTMERAVIIAGEPPVTSEHMAFMRPDSPMANMPHDWQLPPEGIPLEEFEKNIIRQALELTNNNQSAAARLLGLTRSKLRTRVKQLETGN